MAKEAVRPAKQGANSPSKGRRHSPTATVEVFTLQVIWRPGMTLGPDDILSDVPQPGFAVRFRQALLNGDNEAFLVLQPAAQALCGTLRIQIRVKPSVAAAWYQDADAWLQEVATATLKNPGVSVQARGTPRGITIEGRFQVDEKALELDQKLGHKKRKLTSYPSMSHVPHLLDQIVATLPAEPQEQLSAVAALYAALQERLAPKLALSIAALVQGSEVLSYDEKSTLARSINDVLSDTRLAIRDPKTNLPATLLAHRPKVSAPTSYLRIWDTRKASDGKRHFCKLEEITATDRGLELIDERSRAADPQKG